MHPKSFRQLLSIPLLSAVLVAAGCPSTTSKPEASLYQRLGGTVAITAVVDDFVANVAADSRINARFANTDIPRLKRLLVEQICNGTGGPCTYTGRDMKTTHAGMGITDAEFDALVEDLVQSLDKLKVPAAEKEELLGILGPMKADIVEPGAGAPHWAAPGPEERPGMARTLLFLPFENGRLGVVPRGVPLRTRANLSSSSNSSLRAGP